VNRSISPHAGTVTWKLQREISLLLAWGPAILLQLAHPLVARGIADHSSFRAERWGRARRLHRTVDAMLRLCFGAEREAQAVVARINAIHERVHGQLPETAGIFPAGTPYAARDPALLAWVHATLLDMNLRVYERFVNSLPLEEKDRYCVEASTVEEHFAIPAGFLPRSVGHLQQYMDTMLGSGEISVTDAARALARAIVYPAAPGLAAPALWLVRRITIGLLPPTIRADYGFPWGPRDEALLGLSTALVRTLLPLTPSMLRHWPAARAGSQAGSRSTCPVLMSPARRTARTERKAHTGP
jgi:uncharacterized protein (DUF2236 family)